MSGVRRASSAPVRKKCELPMRPFFKLMLKSVLLVQNGHLVTQSGLEGRNGHVSEERSAFSVDVEVEKLKIS